MSQRQVIVDDTNPDIQYSGPWFLVQNTQLNTGNFGTPFQNTLHGVNVDANFSYAFNGSAVTVMGTSITTNTSGTQDPTWECFVDNKSIGWNTVLPYVEMNNWIFCQDNQLQDGPHVLTVGAKVANQNTFWFDQIQYLPSANVSLDQSILRIDSTNPELVYDSGWRVWEDFVYLTQVTGASFTYVFTGVDASFIGYLPANFPLIASTATYSVDGQAPINFSVPIGAPRLYNQILFQIGHMSLAQHKLVVTYQGNSGTAPLAIDYFVVSVSPVLAGVPGTTAIASTAIASTGVPSSSSDPNIPSNIGIGPKKSPPVGIIVGVVVGVTVPLLLLLLLYIRRCNKQKKREPTQMGEASSPGNISSSVGSMSPRMDGPSGSGYG
ncbi:hypothetical protein BYT27DRAFT_7096793 [Phlegmacium glaucopus]|nr:hypothetical protein BYT27DRAFT_7096793 [Phlegmacium glaucopus]